MVGIVCLVDGHSNPVGRVGYLGNRVDDQTVILLAVVGGHNIQAVADVEQGSQVVLVGGGVLLGQIILAQLIGQGFDLSLALVVQGGENPDGGVREGQVFAAGKHTAHDLRGQRCPGAVFHQSDGPVLEIPFRQMMDEFLHEGEDIGIVGGGGQHQLAVAEGVLHSLGHIAAGQIMHFDLGAALRFQLLHQQLHSGLGVTVNGGVSNHNALTLDTVGGPDIIQIDVIAQVFRQHGTVERADNGDIQSGCLLQQSLYLGTIFAHDADVIPAGFAGPVFIHIQGTELAEAIGGEKNLVIGIVGHNDLGPVDHRSRNKGQGVLAQLQGRTFANHDPAIRIIVAEELLHHLEGLDRGDDSGLRIDLQEIGNVGGVVRLHMLHHQVVRFPVLQYILDVVQPFMGEISVHRVHNGNFVIHDDIGIIRHAIGNVILSLKKVHLMIVDTDIADILGNSHTQFSLYMYFIDNGSGGSGIPVKGKKLSSVQYFHGPAIKLYNSFALEIAQHSRHHLPGGTQVIGDPFVGDPKGSGSFQGTLFQQKSGQTFVQALPHDLLHQPHDLRKTAADQLIGEIGYGSGLLHKFLEDAGWDNPHLAVLLRSDHYFKLDIGHDTGGGKQAHIPVKQTV